MRTCTRCIMNDSADPTITFDENGYCNYCTDALAKINTTAYFPNEEGEKRLHALLAELNALEPDDTESDAYEEWAELHEDMEDLIDEFKGSSAYVIGVKDIMDMEFLEKELDKYFAQAE